MVLGTTGKAWKISQSFLDKTRVDPWDDRSMSSNWKISYEQYTKGNSVCVFVFLVRNLNINFLAESCKRYSERKKRKMDLRDNSEGDEWDNDPQMQVDTEEFICKLRGQRKRWWRHFSGSSARTRSLDWESNGDDGMKANVMYKYIKKDLLRDMT